MHLDTHMRKTREHQRRKSSELTPPRISVGVEKSGQLSVDAQPVEDNLVCLTTSRVAIAADEHVRDGKRNATLVRLVNVHITASWRLGTRVRNSRFVLRMHKPIECA